MKKLLLLAALLFATYSFAKNIFIGDIYSVDVKSGHTFVRNLQIDGNINTFEFYGMVGMVCYNHLEQIEGNIYVQDKNSETKFTVKDGANICKELTSEEMYDIVTSKATPKITAATSPKP